MEGSQEVECFSHYACFLEMHDSLHGLSGEGDPVGLSGRGGGGAARYSHTTHIKQQQGQAEFGQPTRCERC